jgi:carbamoyltransferase
MDPDASSPYMLLVAPVKESRRTATDDETGGLERVKQARSDVPAITHVDYSARVQTVDAVRNPRYHALISKFEEKTGCPVIINTSFNIRGEPIVMSPLDAWRCFMGTNMDVLVMEDCILLKSEQPDAELPRNADYLSQFELD